MQYKLLGISILLLCIGFTAHSVAQEPPVVKAYVELSPSELPFFQQAEFRVVVEAPIDLEVPIPDMRTVFEKLKLMQQDAMPPDYNKVPIGTDRVRITETYLLDPIFVMDYFLGSVSIEYGDGQSIELPLPALRVRELTLEEETRVSLFDDSLPAGPDEENRPVSSYVIYWILLGFIGLAIAVVIVYLIWSRIRHIKPAPVKEPWTIALERLERLAARDLPQKEQFSPYYVDLSSILRYYIEGRYFLHAPEQTSQEFLESISGHGYFSPEQEGFLANFLRLCDRVKFARHEPGQIDMKDSFDQVKKFVEETTPASNQFEEAQAA
jgi:hypothetical protein